MYSSSPYVAQTNKRSIAIPTTRTGLTPTPTTTTTTKFASYHNDGKRKGGCLRHGKLPGEVPLRRRGDLGSVHDPSMLHARQSVSLRGLDGRTAPAPGDDQ